VSLTETIAHALWEERGSRVGNDRKDWFDAEELLRGSPLCAPSERLVSAPYGLADGSRIDPLVDVEEDFDRAQVTIVYVRDTTSNERTMLLAVVDLLTPWMEAGPEVPSKPNDPDACLRHPSVRSEVNLRRVVLSAREGLYWYRAVLSGSVALPPTKDERERGERAKVLATGSVADEPPWPRLITERYDERSVETPMVGFRPGGARTHHVLATAPPNLPDWNDVERNDVREWLKNRIHWDVFQRPALLGSAHLIATNPMFRELHVRLAGGARQDVVFLRIDPLPGRSTTTLIATVEDIRPYGSAASVAVPLASRSTEVRLGHEPHMLQVDVYCLRRGLLYSYGPFAFLTSIALNMGLGSGQRLVNVPGRKGRPTTYKVSTSRFERTSVVGTTRPADARGVAAEDVAEVLKLRNAAAMGQQVFMRNVGEAESALRSLIAAAQGYVRIVDPYLGAKELLVFGLANGNLGVRIDVLTSAEFLRRDDEAKLLQAQLEQLTGKPLVNPLEVRVARGKKSPIHDRFLVIDGRAWLVGSSLSELGSRGTVVVQVPDPRPVIALIDQVWDKESTSVQEFIVNRTEDEEAAS
jgi:hypothetical protein